MSSEGEQGVEREGLEEIEEGGLEAGKRIEEDGASQGLSGGDEMVGRELAAVLTGEAREDDAEDRPLEEQVGELAEVSRSGLGVGAEGVEVADDLVGEIVFEQIGVLGEEGIEGFVAEGAKAGGQGGFGG